MKTTEHVARRQIILHTFSKNRNNLEIESKKIPFQHF